MSNENPYPFYLGVLPPVLVLGEQLKLTSGEGA